MSERRVSAVVLQIATGEKRTVKLGSRKGWWPCPFCAEKGHTIYSGKATIGARCSGQDIWRNMAIVDHCTAKVVDLEYRDIPKPPDRILLEFSDNRGNSARVAVCSDKPDAYRKGHHCEQPCVTIGGTNLNSFSPRSHTVHLRLDQVQPVIDALQGFLRKQRRAA